MYPGNLGVLCLSVSLVSWMAAMCMLCYLCSRWCLSCCTLFMMPSMLCCRAFSFVMVCVFRLGGGVGGGEGVVRLRERVWNFLKEGFGDVVWAEGWWEKE